MLGVRRKARNRRGRKLGLSRLDARLLRSGKWPGIKRGLSGLSAGLRGSGKWSAIKRGLSRLSAGERSEIKRRRYRLRPWSG